MPSGSGSSEDAERNHKPPVEKSFDVGNLSGLLSRSFSLSLALILGREPLPCQQLINFPSQTDHILLFFTICLLLLISSSSPSWFSLLHPIIAHLSISVECQARANRTVREIGRGDKEDLKGKHHQHTHRLLYGGDHRTPAAQQY